MNQTTHPVLADRAAPAAAPSTAGMPGKLEQRMAQLERLSRGQARPDAVGLDERLDGRGRFGLHHLGEALAVEQGGGHGYLLS